MSVELLDSNHRDAILHAFDKTKRQIRIISPFIQESVSKHLITSMGRGISSQLITRFYREDFICSVSSLTALKNLQAAGVELFALKDLHAKLYLFDDHTAIIGSANFTGGGFGSNIELSLYIEEEYELIERLSQYFDQLLSAIYAAGDFKITGEKIDSEIQIVQRAIRGRDYTSKPNPARFGADLKTLPQQDGAAAPDEVESILSAPDTAGTSAVLKFEGAAHRRLDPEEKYEPNYSVSRKIYFSASPRPPRSITADTTVFLSAISWDKSGAGVPIIVGRARTKGFDPMSTIDDAIIKEHPWAVDFPYYVELYDIEIVDTVIRNGISLHDLIAEVGYRLYPGTENDAGTSFMSLKTRHHRKSYIAITPYAASRINTMLDSLFIQYGIVRFSQGPT